MRRCCPLILLVLLTAGSSRAAELLKQSTAAVIQFGPFLDKTDGVTLETGLVSALDHASTGIMLSKAGGAQAVRHATVTASTYDAHGCYRVTLDATDTNTLGRLRVIYTDAATCLPVWADFMVVPSTIYDWLVSGSAYAPVNVVQVEGTDATDALTTAADAATPSGVELAADQAVNVTKWGGTVVGSAYVQTNVERWNGNDVQNLPANFADFAIQASTGRVQFQVGTSDGQLATSNGQVDLQPNQMQVAVLGGLDVSNSTIAAADSPGTTELLTRLPDASPGAAGGVFIAGVNADTTVNFTGTWTGNLIGNVLGYVSGKILGGGSGIITGPGAWAYNDAGDSTYAVGDGVNLANGAITENAYDGSTAYPLTSADSGSTRVARTGADGDTLETLSDEIAGISAGSGVQLSDAVSASPTAGTVEAALRFILNRLDVPVSSVSGGSGDYPWELTLTTSGGTPIADASVKVSTDSAANNVVAGPIRTNDFGKVTFYLDAGIYYRWAFKAGVNFTNPQTFTVTAP